MRGRRPGRIVDLDADQLAAHGQRLPDLATQRQHAAGHRRRDLDAGLVGHDVGQRLVLGHAVADLHVPGHQFDLGHPFADVRHLDHAGAWHVIAP